MFLLLKKFIINDAVYMGIAEKLFEGMGIFYL